MIRRRDLAAGLAALGLVVSSPVGAWAQDSGLGSWNEGPTKAAIVGFVEGATRQGPGYVPPAERIAVFDNDGTLWVEQPIYTEVAFSLARAGEMAGRDPALAAKPAFKAAASGDPAQLAALQAKDLLELVVATHSGLTTEEFSAAARTWLATATHPRLKRRYLEATYKPMRELMDYLRAKGFKVFIVSGGDTDFMRVFAEQAYGVPPEQVIGSSNLTRFVQRGDGWALLRTEKMTADDKAAKPTNIALHIGRRPVIAVGNSDGDQQMLQYATAGAGPRLGVLVHHDDAEREFAYDRASKIGTLDKALDEAPKAGWTVVSMKRDWRVVFND